MYFEENDNKKKISGRSDILKQLQDISAFLQSFDSNSLSSIKDTLKLQRFLSKYLENIIHDYIKKDVIRGTLLFNLMKTWLSILASISKNLQSIVSRTERNAMILNNDMNKIMKKKIEDI